MGDLLARLQSALGPAYRVERELGGGGMSRVFLAMERELERQVVVKVLPSEMAAGVNAERFRRESQLAASLQHPHIVPLLAAGHAEDLVYYTMPLIDGESLRAKLAREGELPIPETVRLLRDVADALAYAHAHGVAHRDIKPDNILISGHHALVTDFGVAKALSHSADEPSITTAGVALGTPAYMAPEQAAADAHTDHRCDIYAVGALGYEMLTGRPPFTGATPQHVLAAQVTQAPEPVTKRRATVPSALAVLVMRCLEKSPADRYQTAAELLHQLEAMATPSGGMKPTGAIPAERPSPSGWRTWGRRPVYVGMTALGLLTAYGVFARFHTRSRTNRASARTMLAVLPFENLGSAADEYFADGITEEITSRLATVPGLGVISRTSAMQYKDARKPLKQIAAELGVGYVLEGSVRWEKAPGGSSRVRITPQLIRVKDDTHLWADRYDAVLADVFQVQSAIAEQVTKALNVALQERERRFLAAQPTTNLDAYDAYLHGNSFAARTLQFVPEARRNAVFMYERATVLDSSFALAFARLAIAHLQVYSWYDDRSASRLARAKLAADRALAVDPNLPEAHLALGLYALWGFYDAKRAAEEFDTALRVESNNSELLHALALAQRVEGHWQEALASFDQAAAFDPRSADALGDLAGTYSILRDYAQAIRTREREIAITPDNAVAYLVQAWDLLRWRADTSEARRECQRGVEAAGRRAMARVLLETSFVGAFRGAPVLWQLQDQETVHAIDTLTVAATELRPEQYYVARTQWFLWTGRSDRARAYADSARAVLERRVAEQPDEPNFHRMLGLTYSVLGRRGDAVREGRRAVELLPLARNAVYGHIPLYGLAQIYLMVGEADSAVDQLALLLSIPSQISAPLLRIDPLYAPLQGNRRFERLVGKR